MCNTHICQTLILFFLDKRVLKAWKPESQVWIKGAMVFSVPEEHHNSKSLPFQKQIKERSRDFLFWDDEEKYLV